MSNTHPHAACCWSPLMASVPCGPRLSPDQYLPRNVKGHKVAQFTPHISLLAPHSQLILGCQLSLHAGACNYFYNRLHSREQSIKQDYTTLGLWSLIALIYLHPSYSVLSYLIQIHIPVNKKVFSTRSLSKCVVKEATFNVVNYAQNLPICVCIVKIGGRSKIAIAPIFRQWIGFH